MSAGAAAGAAQQFVQVRVSPTIANEYDTRGVFGPDDADWPEVPGGAGVHSVPRATAQAMLADAEFNGDARQGPSEMPLAIGNAYRALAKQLRALLS